MLEIRDYEVMGFRMAIRGMRNPLSSWDNSDSHECRLRCMLTDVNPDEGECNFICGGRSLRGYTQIGPNDMNLAKRLIKAGSSDRKFLRMIHVQAEVLAPTYFMSEFDTYKIATTRNSSSFMHKGISKRFEIEDFGVDDSIKKILSERVLSKEDSSIIYPYETDEYKIYRAGNGREYEVYKNGRVIAREFTYTDCYGTGRTRYLERTECKPSTNSNGYWELNIGGRAREKWMVHRLVAYLWCDNPNGYETVDHLNGNKNDNSAENLEWVTREENIRRGFNNGLMRKDNLRANYLNWKKASKVLPDIKHKINDDYKAGMKQVEIALKYHISQAQASVIVRNAKNTSDNGQLFENCWYWEITLKMLNELRDMYLETRDKEYFMAIRQLLPMSYLYFSTIDVNYETLINIYFQRRHHKLDEWKQFCQWIERLPYMKEFISVLDNKEESNEQ